MGAHHSHGEQETNSTPPTKQHRSTTTTETADEGEKMDQTTTPQNRRHEHEHKGGGGGPPKVCYQQSCPKLPRPSLVYPPSYCTCPTDAKAPLQLDHTNVALGTRCRPPAYSLRARARVCVNMPRTIACPCAQKKSQTVGAWLGPPFVSRFVRYFDSFQTAGVDTVSTLLNCSSCPSTPSQCPMFFI